MIQTIFKNNIFLFGVIPVCILYVWRYLHTKGWLSYADTNANKAILAKCPTILKGTFTPTIYLQHDLLQTMFSSFVSSNSSKLSYIIEEVDMKGGGHTSLAWAQHNGQYKNDKKSKVLVVIIPGLTGGAKDEYIKDLVNRLCDAGYKCVVYHPRFNGSQLILPDEGHLDILSDFKTTIEHIKDKEKDIKLFGIGHSYGANLLLNYLGTFNQENHFIGAVSLANPYNLMLAENKMRRSVVDRVVTNFLQKTTNRSTEGLKKAVRFKLNLEELQSFKTVRDFDRNFTIKVYGYETVNDYYWGISSCRRMQSIKIPLFMLQAEDDPIVDSKAFVKEEIEKYNPNVILMMTQKGGHQGWVEGLFSLKRWYLRPTLEFVNAVVDFANV